MEKQVDKKAYKFKTYCGIDRFSSYWYQINEVLDCNPKNILEVGIGDKVLSSYLKENTDIEYKNVDIAEDLRPDIISSVDNLNVGSNSFDIVCAFEALEHLPFNKFKQSLLELKRVSKKYVIISLPHFGPPFKLNIKIPFLKELKLSFKIPFPKKHNFNGQHYWEIGKNGYSPRMIKKILSGIFTIKKDFIPFENQYHHFYILEK